MRTYSRDDVQTHYGPDRPAVNIKVYRSVWDDAVWSEFERDADPDEDFAQWMQDNISDEQLDACFWNVCEWGVEYLTGWATGSDAAGDRLFPDHDVRIEQDGRSGGWLVVKGLPDLEDWDAVLLGRWRKFERIARDIADGVPVNVLSSLYINEYEWAKEEERESQRAANQDIATVPA